MIKYSLFFTIFMYLFSVNVAKPYNYTILVLPSGGATAVISAVLLQHLEEKTGQSTNQLFDEIWCSSAGSIIGSLLTTKSHSIKAQDVINFFTENFGSYYKAYHICNALKTTIGADSMLSETSIPLRILTATKNFAQKKWELYDFSSDGAGSCSDTQIPIAAAVKGSCTVYPYLHLHPEKIKIHNKEYVDCIDPGSLICDSTTVDPTAYFLEQTLQRLKLEDTLTIYFLCTAFTPTLDLQEIEHILQKYTKFSSEINYYEGSIDQTTRPQVRIINVSMQHNCAHIVEKYINKGSVAVKFKINSLITFLAKIVGKENAVANLLATGTIPLSELIEEAQMIIKKSKNFKTMVGLLQKKDTLT